MPFSLAQLPQRAYARQLARTLTSGRSEQRELYEVLPAPSASVAADVSAVRLERGRRVGDVWLGHVPWRALRLDRFGQTLLCKPLANPPCAVTRDDVRHVSCSAVLAKRLPPMQQQFFDLPHGMRRDACKHISEVLERINPVEFCRLDQARDRRRALTRTERNCE